MADDPNGGVRFQFHRRGNRDDPCQRIRIMRAPRHHDRLRGASGATPCRAALGNGGTIPPSSALSAGSGRRSNHRSSSRSALLYISAGTNA